MDPKVFGKLLTTHRRGLGDDVEAIRARFPSGRALEKAPRWDLTGTEGCGGGNRVLWCSWIFVGYVDIYRRKKYVGGATRGPRGWRARHLPRGWLVACLTYTPISWIAFIEKITFPKVSFHLGSV